MSVANSMLSVIVLVIITVAVAVPITASVVTTANLSGVNATIAGFLSTFLILSVLVAIVTAMSV